MDWCLRNSYIANEIRSLFQIIQLQLLVGLLVVLRLLLRLLLASLLFLCACAALKLFLHSAAAAALQLLLRSAASAVLGKRKVRKFNSHGIIPNSSVCL